MTGPTSYMETFFNFVQNNMRCIWLTVWVSNERFGVELVTHTKSRVTLCIQPEEQTFCNGTAEKIHRG